MEHDGIFKPTLFGGFYKKDVLNYVDNMGRDYQEKIEELEERLSKINEERNNFASEVQTQANLLEDLKQQVDLALNRNQDLLRQNKEQKEILSKQSAQTRSREEEIELLRHECKQLLADVDVHREKSNKYDTIKEEISSTIMEAQRLSSEIVTRGKNQADEIAIETKRSMDHVASNLLVSKESITSIREKLDYIYQEFGTKMIDLETSMADVVSSLSAEDAYYSFLENRSAAHARELHEKSEQPFPQESKNMPRVRKASVPLEPTIALSIEETKDLAKENASVSRKPKLSAFREISELRQTMNKKNAKDSSLSEEKEEADHFTLPRNGDLDGLISF